VKKPLKLQGRAHSVVVLSSLQQRILRSIETVTLRIKLHGTAEAKTTLAAWGVRWKPGADDPHWTAAKRAACSRSVKRLERRGLVRRRNWRNPQGRRTTHIALSPEGEAVAHRLAVQASRDVNRLARHLERRRRDLARRFRRRPSQG
jgi:hypothetical protein